MVAQTLYISLTMVLASHLPVSFAVVCRGGDGAHRASCPWLSRRGKGFMPVARMVVRVQPAPDPVRRLYDIWKVLLALPTMCVDVV